MAKLARLTDAERTGTFLECVFARDIDIVLDDKRYFFVLSQHAHTNLGIDSKREILLYSPDLELQIPGTTTYSATIWVADKNHFDIVEESEINVQLR